MTRASTPTIALAAALLGACVTPDGYQREYAHVMRPAPIRPSPGAQRPAELATLRLLAYADAGYRAHAPDWEARIRDQVGRANVLLEAEFGVRLEVTIRRWERAEDDGKLPAALRALTEVDGEGADWVAGFVGPVPEDAWIDNLGLAAPFYPRFVLRAMLSPAQLAGFAMSYDHLGEEEHLRIAEERRLHREVVVFLHEWAHTLGAVHECDLKWIMAEEYAVMTSGFSPESARLVGVGLRHRGRAGGPAAHAWRDAWRAEAARMEPRAWECATLEEALAKVSGLLDRLPAGGAPEAAAPRPAAAARP